ncbi:hypothetical protein NUM3379_07650 [Kineococcus sp. NUM-3379]
MDDPVGVQENGTGELHAALAAAGAPAPWPAAVPPPAPDPWALLQRTQAALLACPDAPAVAAALAAALTATGLADLLVLAPPTAGRRPVLAAAGRALPPAGTALSAADLAALRPARTTPLDPADPDGALLVLLDASRAARPVVAALCAAAALALTRTTEATARRAAERERAATSALLDGARSLSGLGTWHVEPATGRVHLDERLRDMLGLGAGTTSVDLDTWCGWVHADDRGRFTAGAAAGGPATYPLRLHTPDGQEHTLLGWSAGENPATGPAAACTAPRGLALDLTADGGRTGELVRLAHSDSLTGLPNRTLLDTRLAAALRTAAPDRAVVLVMLDLDRFKLVNDTLGHQVGDALLRQVADRLRHAAPPGATLARLGGDEFVVCIPGVDRPEAAYALARNLVRSLRAPYQLPGTAEPLVCTASAGVAVATGGSTEDLLRSADMALYRAKDDGRDRCALYDSAMREDAQARLDSERMLRRALREDGLRLVWQPIVDLRDRRLVAAECLVRLQDPTEGLLMPATFVDTAEDTGLIVDVDSWVLTAALEQLERWRSTGSDVQVSVNVSGRTLEHPAFAHRLAHSVQRSGAAGSSLLAEVTERTLIDLTVPTRASLHELQSCGARVGLDDFGTGYSSLAYLERFPLNFLKIDRSFVTPLGTSERADAVVEAVIALAHAHGMVVTAEGVETELQAERLTQMGCDRAQGWLFGRPVPAEQLALLPPPPLPLP